MNKDQKQGADTKKNGTGLAVGVIAGAALGAVAVAALSDKKNRQKVMDTVSTLKDKAMDTVSQVQEKSEDIKAQATDRLEEEKQKIQEQASKSGK